MKGLDVLEESVKEASGTIHINERKMAAIVSAAHCALALVDTVLIAKHGKKEVMNEEKYAELDKVEGKRISLLAYHRRVRACFVFD